MTITEADYPKITELLTVKKTITLDCEPDYSEEEMEDGENLTYLNFADNEEFYGNMESRYLVAHEDPKAFQKRFKTFVQPDGEIGLEISFLPGPPLDQVEGHAKAIWDNTRLHEIMTYEEYLKDIEEEVEWTWDCFGDGGEMYALMIEVTKPGRPGLSEEFFDPILEKPLWIQRKGQKYNVHVRFWQD